MQSCTSWIPNKEEGLKIVNVLVEGDAVLWGICVSSSGFACKVPFIDTRCVSNWSMHISVDRNGPDMRLEWV